jgi:hypothetical protein
MDGRGLASGGACPEVAVPACPRASGGTSAVDHAADQTRDEDDGDSATTWAEKSRTITEIEDIRRILVFNYKLVLAVID